jgi:hypothetical protein
MIDVTIIDMPVSYDDDRQALMHVCQREIFLPREGKSHVARR